MLIGASVGQALLQFGGARIRDRIPWQPVRAVDAVGGSLLSVVAVLVVAWALGVAVSGARLPWVSDQVRESAVLGRVDQVVPDQADSLLDSFNRVVGTSFFPRYLEPFAQERIVDGRPAPGAGGLRPGGRGRRGQRAEDPRGEPLRPRRRGHRLPLPARTAS